MHSNNFEQTDIIQESLNTFLESSEANYGLEVALLSNNSQDLIQNENLLLDEVILTGSQSNDLELDIKDITGRDSTVREGILFVDSAVEDYQVLIDNSSVSTEVVVLDSDRDGLIQIQESLSQYKDLDEVYIVSHGAAGKLYLGNTELSRDSLPQYADILKSWGNFIAEDGDILLYGCNIAEDIVGSEFIDELSEYTQADISASTDETGNSKLGGDWELEASTGAIEGESLFDSEILESYQHILVGSSFNFSYVDLVLDPTPIDFDSINLELNSDINDLDFGGYNFQSPELNTILFDFEPSVINFNAADFDFDSLSIANDSITFEFNPDKFNFDALTTISDSMEFGFDSREFNFDSKFSFDADSVTFESGKVSFKYKGLDVNQDLFSANADLFTYKFSFTEVDSDFSFDRLNASDFRALDYAFKGDELFDTEYYLAHDVTPFGMNPFTDYIENGFQAGLNPNALFDVNYYLDHNSDVRIAGMEPLTHYALFGYSEDHQNRDPSALFDTSYYNANNPDVVAAGEISLLHYIQFGNTEHFDNRDPNQFFDNSYY